MELNKKLISNNHIWYKIKTTTYSFNKQQIIDKRSKKHKNKQADPKSNWLTIKDKLLEEKFKDHCFLIEILKILILKNIEIKNMSILQKYQALFELDLSPIN